MPVASVVDVLLDSPALENAVSRVQVTVTLGSGLPAASVTNTWSAEKGGVKTCWQKQIACPLPETMVKLAGVCASAARTSAKHATADKIVMSFRLFKRLPPYFEKTH